ncbi:MAG: BlaI/MecI/CopY family transcriptional regulator [Glaciecola sp.]
MSVQPSKSISNAELVVMECIWQHSQLDPKALTSLLDGKVDWHENTIRTLLLRLLKKGYVRRESYGRAFRYRAATSRKEYVSQRIELCIDELFEGSTTTFLETVIDLATITNSDISRLTGLLDKKRKLPLNAISSRL